MKTKTRISYLFFFALLTCACSYRVEGYGSSLDSLLENPTEDSFFRWEKIAKSISDDCDQEGGFDNVKRTRLFDLIKDGSSYAAQVGIMSFHCWEGGELEDFYRSVGIFFDRNPEEFMRIVHKKSVSEDDLGRMVSMLPLESADNIEARAALIEARIEALGRFSGSQHLIQVLEDYKKHLKRAP